MRQAARMRWVAVGMLVGVGQASAASPAWWSWFDAGERSAEKDGERRGDQDDWATPTSTRFELLERAPEAERAAEAREATRSGAEATL